MTKKYVVTMCRISYGFRDIEVEAETEEEATTKAHDTAGDYLYDEKTSDYEVDAVREVT